MTREKTITVTVCDGCGGDCDHPYACLRCGKSFCYSCLGQDGEIGDKQAVVYRHSVNAMGSGDGTYCRECDLGLTARTMIDDGVHEVYCRIANLRTQSEFWNKAWSLRAKEAEMELAILQKRSAVEKVEP